MTNSELNTLRNHEYINEETEKGIMAWVNGQIIEIPPLTSCFMKSTHIIKYVSMRYKRDKKIYQETGTWPEVGFHRYDDIYNYYYLLKLTDTDIELDKYFDFDYDTKKWPRDEIISLIFAYGIQIIPHITRYLREKINIPFYEWYKKETYLIKEFYSKLKPSLITIPPVNMDSDSTKWKYNPEKQNEKDKESQEQKELRERFRKNLINNLRKRIKTVSLLIAYNKDKQEYLKTGAWPNTNFRKKDRWWAKYFFLQLTDEDVKLNKYFDFDYDTAEWTRDKLIDLVLGNEIESLIKLSLHSQTDKSTTLSEYIKARSEGQPLPAKTLIRIKYDQNGNIEEFTVKENK